MSERTNWRAMQAAGALKMKDKVHGVLPRPSDVLTRYMSMGSWHADLSKGGLTTPGSVKGRN